MMDARTWNMRWGAGLVLLAMLAAGCSGGTAGETGGADGGDSEEATDAGGEGVGEDQDSPDSTETESATRIRVAASTPLLWPHIWVAEGEGLWGDAGLEAEVVQFATGGEAQQALLGGDVDVATVAPTPITVAAYNELPVRVIGVATRWSEWRIQARGDSGIETPADLEGKKIGVTIGTSSELAWNRFTSLEGVDASSVEVVNVSPPDMVPALSTGSVDAIVIWQPFVRRAEQTMGEGLVSLPFEFTNNYLLTTTADMLSENRELIERFLQVMATAEDFILENREAAAAYVAEPAGTDAEDILAVWEEMEFTLGAPDERVLEEMEYIAETRKQSGDISDDAEFDLTSIFVDIIAQ